MWHWGLQGVTRVPLTAYWRDPYIAQDTVLTHRIVFLLAHYHSNNIALLPSTMFSDKTYLKCLLIYNFFVKWIVFRIIILWYFLQFWFILYFSMQKISFTSVLYIPSERTLICGVRYHYVVSTFLQTLYQRERESSSTPHPPTLSGEFGVLLHWGLCIY